MKTALLIVIAVLLGVLVFQSFTLVKESRLQTRMLNSINKYQFYQVEQK